MSSCEEHLAKSAARTTWFGWHFCDCLSHILKEKDQCSSGVNPTHEQYATTTTTSFSRSVQHRSDNGLCIRVNCSHTCMHLASGKRVALFPSLFQLRASRFCSQVLYLLFFFRFHRVLSCIAPRRIVVFAPSTYYYCMPPPLEFSGS